VLCGEIFLENSIGFHEVSYEVSGVSNKKSEGRKQKVGSWEGEKVGAAFPPASPESALYGGRWRAGSRDNYAGFVNANTHYLSRKSKVRNFK
jgi:hypothetical protein